ncbi:hypothetical protein ACJVC5_01135 [Peredibacter sp. HCB2-198]|uniref:hypothetical protein n=1 Tax=Peredibacter sp. HCB2-198 TaxID=3383025 RepID=UPI0038B4E0AB
MKNLTLTTLVFSIPLTALANVPIRPDGLYQFKSIKVSQVRDSELVHVSNRSRFLELVKDKFQCYNKGDFFQCQKHIKGVSLPQNLSEDLKKEWKNKTFEFLPSNLAPLMTNDAPDLMEWDIQDTVKFNNERITQYHYYLVQQDVHKANLNFKTQQWINIQDEEEFSVPVRKTLQLSQWQSRIFELSLIFQK